MTFSKAAGITILLAFCPAPSGANDTAPNQCQKAEAASVAMLPGLLAKSGSNNREAVAEIMDQLECTEHTNRYSAGHQLALSLLDAHTTDGRDGIAAQTVRAWQDSISFDGETRLTSIPENIRNAAMFIAWTGMTDTRNHGTSTTALVFLAQAISAHHSVDLPAFQAFLEGHASSSHDRQITKFNAWQLMRYLWTGDRFGQNVQALYSATQLAAFEKSLMSTLALPRDLE